MAERGQFGHHRGKFVSKLKPGNTFWFAGRSLEFIRVKEMTAYVKRSNAKKGLVPTLERGRYAFIIPTVGGIQG